MRVSTLSKLLVLGGTAAWAYTRFVRPGPARRDPVQPFDPDLQVAELDFDAIDAADAEAARDLAIFESDLDEAALDVERPAEPASHAADASAETGELYGVHTPPAVDRELPDDDRAELAGGQNWIEALETSAIEYGAEPEHDLDVVDDQDTPPHPSDTRDTPVADRGSGGPGGV